MYLLNFAKLTLPAVQNIASVQQNMEVIWLKTGS